MQLAKHIRFVDSDDEEQNGMQEQPITSRIQPSLDHSVGPVNFSLLSSISVDYDKSDQCYVLHLAHARSTSTVAAALSNRCIKLFSLTNAGLQFTGDILGHTGRITSAQCPLSLEPFVLYTSSADGTVKEWDLRGPLGHAVRSFHAGNQEVSCCASNGNFIAAGVKDNVLFWDRSSARPTGSFTDTHFQDVTQVVFHPNSKSTLISGSDDGLIAVFDTSMGLDEDEGFRAALNIDTAVAKVGFYGHGGDKLWCCSGTETLHLWEWAAACDDDCTGGNGALGQSLDIREKLQADYLIQCEYNESGDELVVIIGSNIGSAALAEVQQPPKTGSNSTSSIDLEFTKPPRAVLQGGHSDVVRSMLWLNELGPYWVSGGEDARVCVWSSIAGGGGDGTHINNSAPAMHHHNVPLPSDPDCGSGSTDTSGYRRGHMKRASPY